VIDKRNQGVTLIELVVVIVIVGVMTSIAVPAMKSLRDDQQLRSSVREVANAFSLARAHAVRSGSNVIVVFQSATGAAPPAQIQTGNIIDIVVDGVATSADCTIDASEVVWTKPQDPAATTLSWGTTPGNAGTTPVPSDPGLAASNSFQGATFTDATVSTGTVDSSKFASWVVFQPDGLPRLMTPASCATLGAAGQGGGGIYVTNGRRDYAVILSALGTVRVHNWEGSQWSE